VGNRGDAVDAVGDAVWGVTRREGRREKRMKRRRKDEKEKWMNE
jgi:hypothetical protein